MEGEERIKFHRPANDADFKLTAKEKDMIAVKVLLGYSNVNAYGLFNPHLCDNSGRLNKPGQTECRMFFTHPTSIAYSEALKEHLEKLTKGGIKTAQSSEVDDNRKDRALKSLLNQAMSLMERGEDLDPDTIKVLSDIAVKLKLLKDEEQTEIRPLRFLPAKCGECRYKIGVESAVLNSQMLDMCAYCKCRKIAEENGYRFNDGKDLLEIPKEIIAELESKNNVKLTDILDGKIEN